MGSLKLDAMECPPNPNQVCERIEGTRMSNWKAKPAPAIQVQKAFKKYGNGPPILDDFNMTVEQGTIYGLLGASGCGKTTILSCIVGLRNLDSGGIHVFDKVPGTKDSGIPGNVIGYMPQDISLYQVFTIKEMLQYFGRIYGMSQSKIDARLAFFMPFLELPESSQFIGSLSGGQQRRVSLAVAMIHQPQLLILDEPTVGLDPLLRESIWNYLLELVITQRTTVIITTHYIEEARHSHMIGLMRNGRLLTEKPPMTLLKEHNATLLEEIVLELCKKDSKKLASPNVEVTHPAMFIPSSHKTVSDTVVVGLTYKKRSPDDLTILRPRRPKLERSLEEDLWSHVNKIQALATKNIIMFIRHPMLVISCLLCPLNVLVLMELILGDYPVTSSLGVVNHEFESLDFLETCKRNNVSCLNDNLSCNLLNAFPPSAVNWIPLSSEHEALERVKDGSAVGYISIPSNFTQNLRDRLLTRNFATTEMMDGSDIRSKIDMSNYFSQHFAKTDLYDNYFEFMKQIVSECGGESRAIEIPLQYKSADGTPATTFTDFFLPGFLLLITFALPMASAVNLILDRKGGTVERSMVAGVNFFHILVAHIISEGLLIIMELAAAFGLIIVVFGWTSKGSVILCFLLAFLQGITGLSIGFLIGTISNHELEVIIGSIAVFMPCSQGSGLTWPLEGIAPIIRPFFKLFPTTLSIQAFRSIANRGWGIEYSEVWQGFASLGSWSFGCCLLSFIIHRMKK